MYIYTYVYNHPRVWDRHVEAEWSDEMENKTPRTLDAELDVESSPLAEGDAKINSTCRVRSSWKGRARHGVALRKRNY